MTSGSRTLSEDQRSLQVIDGGQADKSGETGRFELDYIADMIGELQQMAERGRHDVLSGLLQLAHQEATRRETTTREGRSRRELGHLALASRAEEG